MDRTGTALSPRHDLDAQPDLSVVIVNWNAAKFLRPCLQSLCDGMDPSQAEIIVVDNASTDSSIELLRSEFPQIQLVCNESNSGFARATNQGIRLGSGAYVLLLNPDTVLTPTAIPLMLDFLRTNPRVAAVGPRMLNGAGQTLESYASFPSLLEALRVMMMISTASFECLTDPSGRSPMAVDWVGGACMLVRREVFEQIGLFDETYFMYWEEADLCWRMHNAGWDVYYLPEPVITHYCGGSAAQATDRLYFNGLLLSHWTHSSRLFFLKYYSPWACAGFFSILVFSALLGMAISPILFLTQPDRRAQLVNLPRTYLKSVAAAFRAVLQMRSRRERAVD